MGTLFRSEEMTLCQLFLQSEAAYACVSELGELGLVQFRDLNPDVNAFQRKFVNEVRRCDEMERKLRFLEKEIKKDGIPMLDTGDNPEAPAPREMIDLEATFEKLENEMKEVNANSEALKRNYLELTELKHILRKTQGFFEEDEHHSIVEDAQQALATSDQHSAVAAPLQLGFVAGVILRERIPAFERMLWRVCRGNVFLKQAEIETPLEDPVSGDQVNKSVFIIFFQGDQLKSRVKKICEGFRATLYPCPETPAERREMAIGVMTRIEDLNTVLGQTQDHRHRVLVAAAKNIKNWFVKVKKIKAIYHTLNMFNLDVTQKCLIAECWCPVAELDKIQLALRRGTDRSGSSVPSILNRMTTKEAPPTYHKTNKFTGAFQSIIDAYGVNTYGEMNPTPYTIITFPFLFSLMFGDAGHGFVMFLFALVLVIKEKQIMASKLDDEIANTFFGGRYIIMMMGLFSCYSGMIYNDIFSRSTNIFGSSWTVPESEFVVNGTTNLKHFPSQLQGDPNMTAYFTRGVYPFGIDPVWQLAENKITYTNSFKMKLSIIMGVFQMMFGVWLGLFNHMHFKNKLSIFCEFIPQVLFLLCMFGYLVLLVFVKWFVFNAIDNGMNTNCAPSLLIGLINMFLFTYPKRGQAACSTITWYGGAASFFVINNGDVTQEEGQGQQVFQIILVLLALLCVPWMLLTKPLLLKFSPSIRASYMASKKHGEQAESAPADTTSEQEIIHHDAVQVSTSGAGSPAPGGAKEEDFDFAEVFIHTAIHTIEYCLGTISHTASYLRLWALSLAHAQLSEVLWDMVLQIGLRQGRYYGGVILVPIFAAWVVLTIAILLLMEGLSAFLHTLRLHWVEFQSKFYKGEGYAFHAFDFQQIIETAEE
ncbi:V-type proton ATPase 116 kDa subunit a isoform X2 [Lingula anatina]|uniref:V-type proton ATPase subunit a n=1 Tax=Lingula anatina TaxID=7574 RepID=A0A1S3JUW3_LINAN|nr:V-type proton ATPase 116 kDa subunit a isoform X2 [Lingula anatina]|eukprot:XP_013413891.1 V-type proton ATPase 116 kDa subunit a isoform X2 [Lingula anatina]